MRKHLHRTAIAGAVGALMLVAGCGNSSSGNDKTADKPPKDQLTAAVEALGNGKTLSIALKLGASAADLQALAASGGEKIDARTAGLISGARIVIEVKSDKKLSEASTTDTKGSDVRLFAKVDNSDVVEFRVVDDVFYLRADVAKIAQIADNPEMVAGLQAQAAQLPPFVKAGLEGKWLSLPADTAKSLAEQFGGGAVPTPGAEQQQKLIADLKAMLQRDVEVTREDSDSTKGDHLVLKADSKKLADDFVKILESSGLPNLPTDQLDSADVPQKTITVDAWVKDDKLSEISFDLVQFADGEDAKKLAGKSIPITFQFSDEVGDISKPDGATQIDMSQILPLLGALGGQA